MAQYSLQVLLQFLLGRNMENCYSLQNWGTSVPRCIRSTFFRRNAPCLAQNTSARTARQQQALQAAKDPLQFGFKPYQPRAPLLRPVRALPDKSDSDTGTVGVGDSISFSSLGIFLLWGGLIAYAFFIAPNQTPIRFVAFNQKTCFLGLCKGRNDT